MQQSDIDVKREKELSHMIARLDAVLQRDGFMRRKLEEATAIPSSDNVQELGKLMQTNRANISEVLPIVELFEEQVGFVDEPQRPLPQQIISQKIGLVEHAVIEQMQRIDAGQHQPIRYDEFNRLLSRKIQAINNTIDNCLTNVNLRL